MTIWWKLLLVAPGARSYSVPLQGCAGPAAIVAFADRPIRDFGEPWQGKGLTCDMPRTILCPEPAP